MSAGGFLGMNPAEVRELARLLDQKASEVDAARTECTAKIQSVEWKGQDAEKFRSEWEGQHAPNLQRASEQMKQAAQAANRNADEQEQTSAQ